MTTTPIPPTLEQQLDDLLQKWAKTPAGTVGEGLDPTRADWAAAIRIALLQAAQPPANEEDVARFIQRQLGQIEQWRAWLEGVRHALPDLAAVRRRHARRQPGWWEEQRQALQEAFVHDPTRAGRQWFRLFAEALVDGQLDICRRLTRERFPFPSGMSATILSYLVRIEDLETGRYERALEMLLDLATRQLETPVATQEIEGAAAAPAGLATEPATRPETRALLHILIGRIQLQQRGDRPAAQQSFERAVQIAPDFGPGQAALGHFFHHQNQERKAAAHFNRAIELSPGEPDGYVGMALLAEGQQWWQEANNWYIRAIEAVADEVEPAAYLARLQAPVSGNLYLHLARHLLQQHAYQATLTALEQATALGVHDGTDYPSRILQELKGRAWRALGQRPEAAAAFYEAGRRYYWLSDYEAAIRCLRYARRLQPERANTYWYLADAWRILSYRPEPPYVHLPSARRGCVIWEAGAQRHSIDRDNAWAYIVRARLADRLARAPGATPRQAWWLAAALCERALLWEASSSRWAALATFYRFLSLEANGLEAARQALALDPNERTALEEQAAITVNQGYFAEALPVLDRLIDETAGQDRLLYLGWKAIAVYFLEAWEEAVRLIEAATQPDTKDIWDRTVRANIYRLAGQTDKAQADYAWVWQQRLDPIYAHAGLEIGWAAYQLGHFQAAQMYLTAQLPNRDHTFDAALYLSLCYLAVDDVAAADGMAEKAFQELIWLRQAEDARILWEEQLRRPDLLPTHQQALQGDLARLAHQREALREPDQLKELAQARQEGSEMGAPAWQALQAAAGRLHLSQGNWAAAADSYQRLAGPGANFPEAQLGLEKIAAALQSAVRQALQAEHPVQALSILDQAATLPLPSRQASDFSAWRGLAQVMQGDLAEGMRAFQTALLQYQAAGLEAGSTLGMWCAANLNAPVHYWQLAHSFQAQEGAEWEAAGRTLSRYLDDAFHLSVGADDEPPPAITPIAVTIQPTLLPADTSSAWVLFKRHLPDMRQRIWQRMGVRLPGVRIREGDDDFETGSYFILLDEVPQAVGQLHANHFFILHPLEEVATRLQAATTEWRTAPIPGQSGSGCWAPMEYLKTAEAANLPLWSDPWEYLTYHLESVLTQQLALFLHTQAVQELLEEWPQTPDDHTLIISALPDAPTRLRFGRLLRALVSEGVSISNWRAILRQLQATGLPNEDITDALQAVRFVLSADLPGNQPQDAPILLPATVEEAIAPWIIDQGKQRYLALPPQVTQTILAEVRAGVGQRPAQAPPITVVEVRDSAIRLFVHHLLRLEQPHWRVIATPERLTAGRQEDHHAA